MSPPMLIMLMLWTFASGQNFLEPRKLQSAAAKCYIAQCGCPGSFLENWCNEGNALISSCDATLCETNCNGKWCDALMPSPSAAPSQAPSPTPVPMPSTGEGSCYIAECGCPGSFLQSWCNNVNAGNKGCLKNSELCESSCRGIWCPTATPGPIAQPTPAPSLLSPTPVPTPDTTQETRPAPTPTPTLAPTPSPAPAPTHEAGPTPSPTPTLAPTPVPTLAPTQETGPAPTPTPTLAPIPAPTPAPTQETVPAPTPTPTLVPTSGVTELAPGYQVTNVKSTMWASQSDSGGCEMPKTDYSVQHAVAIGDAAANALLTAQSSNKLCGQVVSLDCGGVPVRAVIASVCNKNAYNCGVDLIMKTWDIATGGKAPGITQCMMALTDTLPMTSGSDQCFFRPSSENGNSWYASVGVFNTGGRLPASATLNGIGGTFNGDSAYFDFNGDIGAHTGSTVPLVVNFTDGTSVSIPYGSCAWVGEAYIWS